MASSLQEACDKALDKVAQGKPLQDWPLLGLNGLPGWVKLPLKFKVLSKLGMPAAEQQVVRQLRMVSALVAAHQAAQVYMRQHLQVRGLRQHQLCPGHSPWPATPCLFPHAQACLVHRSSLNLCPHLCVSPSQQDLHSSHHCRSCPARRSWAGQLLQRQLLPWYWRRARARWRQQWSMASST